MKSELEAQAEGKNSEAPRLERNEPQALAHKAWQSQYPSPLQLLEFEFDSGIETHPRRPHHPVGILPYEIEDIRAHSLTC